MAPRRYNLGKRATAVMETRERIIEAAIALYQQQGITNTSMQDVARGADVAPGTVLNHFPSPDLLTKAVVAQLMVDLRYPSEEIFNSLATVRERIRALAGELAGFYKRSEPWYYVSLREGGHAEALAEAEAEFYQHLDQLMRKALGPLGSDEQSVAAVSAIINPAVFGTLQARGISVSDSGKMAADILTPWLEQRERELT